MIQERLSKVISDAIQDEEKQLIKIKNKKFKDYTFEDFMFLHEQAVQKRELEVELERIKVKYRATKAAHYRYSHITSELEHQNIIYREAFEDILRSDTCTWGFHQIAHKALEGVSNDK